jgi:hypothetical protein
MKATGPLFDPRNLSRQFDREIRAEVAQLGALAQRYVVQGTPRGISAGGGGLAGSIDMTMRGTVGEREAVVSSSVFYAPIVEEGRNPGRPPSSRHLLLWVERKLGVRGKEAASVAFLVARKIGRVGISGSYMFRRAAARLEPIAGSRWDALGERLARIANGAP